MRFKFFFLLLFIISADTLAQTPFTNFLKAYVETKGVEVGQENLNKNNVSGGPSLIYASFKTVTVDEEYPKVLKGFRRNLESLLDKTYTLVSFTKDADNEDINKVYKFIKDSTAELVHYQKEEDQVTVHVFEMVFNNMKEDELKRMPLTINMNQGPGAKPMKFDFFPVQNGKPDSAVLPKTDTTTRIGHVPIP